MLTHPRWRRLTASVVAVLAGALAAEVAYHVSVQPGAAIVRVVFERGAEVRPPAGFAAIVLWIHGGGFISSSAATIRDYAILLAHRARLHRR